MKTYYEILRVVVGAAVFANVFLFIFSSMFDLFDLQILSIVNIILLSFVFLLEERK